MKKRGNGEGSIRQVDGYWEARIMIGYNEKGKPKYKTFTNKKRSIVVKKLADFIANRDKQQHLIPYNEPLANWLKTWYEEYVVANVKTSTRISYEAIINQKLIPNLGHLKLRALKKTEIEAMYRKLILEGRANKEGGLSVKTVKNIALVLHEALAEAVRREYIISNPASMAKVPTMRSTQGTKKEIAVLTREEQKRLMMACGNDVYGTGVITILNTGVRLGELLGIQWRDIDFDKRTISISKQVNRLKDYSQNAEAKTRLGIQNDTKTKKSRRIVAMNDALAEKLQAYRERQEMESGLWGSKYKQLDMVFAREGGNYMDPATFRDNYRCILKRAGLKPFTVHALRHTFATRALEAGIPIKVVSNLLGHASVQITMDTYSHVLPELQSEAVNKIAEYYMKMAQ